MRLSIMTACASLALLTTPAFAELSDTVEFTYNTEELKSAKGINSLYERIEIRADKLCHDINPRRNRQHDECVADLVDDFVASIDHPRLSALHEDASEDSRYASR